MAVGAVESNSVIMTVLIGLSLRTESSGKPSTRSRIHIMQPSTRSSMPEDYANCSPPWIWITIAMCWPSRFVHRYCIGNMGLFPLGDEAISNYPCLRKSTIEYPLASSLHRLASNSGEIGLRYPQR
jgi:hypothetical protein